ncbi:MAG TPA: HDOD domain-containing protein [Planctomycetaceae bacterium]|nr:HDOD domain-containing protein [Planctomycetaceae bacterium]
MTRAMSEPSEGTVEREARVQVSASHAVDELASRGRELFTLPKVAVDVLELTNQPHTDAAALKACIECDPALTARILRVVNSSLFGLGNRVTDLAHAIGLLGIKPLKMLVLGFNLPPALFEGLDEEALQLYWKTSLIRAAASREIARVTGSADGDEAFLTGLLEGLGILLLIQHLKDAYTNFYLQVESSGRDLAEVEREQFGFHHRQLTAKLLQNWKFPREWTEAIVRPATVSNQGGLASILELADHLTRFLAHPEAIDVRPLINAAADRFGLTIDQVQQLVDHLEGSVPSLAEIFSLPWDQAQYVQCLTTAHQLMSELAEDPDAHVSPATASHPSRDEGEAANVRSALNAWLDRRPVDSRRSVPTSRAPSPTPPCAAAAAPVAIPRPTTFDPGLVGRLRQAILLARRTQRSVGLCLFEFEDAHELKWVVGPECLPALEEILRQLVEAELEPSFPSQVVRDGQVAAVCIGHDRSRIAHSARAILDQLGPRVERELAICVPASAAAGAAVVRIPTKNLDPAEIVEAAERCLYAAHSAGGQTVKTIER